MESRSESHTIDKSTEFLGVKVGGTTETERHTYTTVQNKEEGFFVNTSTVETTDETIHTKSTHHLISDEVEILRDTTISTREIEHELTACGLGFMTPFAKLAVEFYKSGGDLDVEKAVQILAAAASVSTMMLCFAKLLGPQAAMAILIIAGMVTKMPRENMKLLASRSTEWCAASWFPVALAGVWRPCFGAHLWPLLPASLVKWSAWARACCLVSHCSARF